MSSTLRLLSQIESQMAQYNHRHSRLSPKMEKLKKLMEDDFYQFVKHMWRFSGADGDFLPNWHINALCEHLQACYEGRIRYLLINVPPRAGKSLICSVMFVAWVWAKDPTKQFIATSYAEKLAARDNNYCRALIQSPLYQHLWGGNFSLVKKQDLLITNSKGGVRVSVGLGGSITGHGAWCIIIDDPNNIRDVETKSSRERTNQTVDSVLPSRLNNRETGVIIGIQQRTHENDYTGHILSKKLPYVVHLFLPMLYEEDRHCTTVPLRPGEEPWTDPRSEEGELLIPNRFNEASIERIKNELRSAYDWAGQYQQSPAPQTGGIIDTDWFQYWKEEEPPECYFTIQSWDTAFTIGEGSSYSACTTWGIFKDRHNIPNLILLDLWRGKVQYPELRHMAQRLYRCYHDNVLEAPFHSDGPSPDIVLIEERASGYSLIQDLKRAGVPVRPFNPKRRGMQDSSKEARAQIVSHLIEAGRVWVPLEAPDYDSFPRYVETFLEACALFPRSDTRDLIDTMSMTLLQIMEMGEVWHPTDERGNNFPVYDERKPGYKI